MQTEKSSLNSTLYNSCVCRFRSDAGSKVAKTDEASHVSHYNNVYDGSTDYSASSGYAANSAYQYNTAQWPGYGTTQQTVCIEGCATLCIGARISRCRLLLHRASEEAGQSSAPVSQRHSFDSC